MKLAIEDNIYPLGTRIAARENPTLPLVVHTYYQRIYYCAVVDKPEHKHFAYFERELIPPVEASQAKKSIPS